MAKVTRSDMVLYHDTDNHEPCPAIVVDVKDDKDEEGNEKLDLVVFGGLKHPFAGAHRERFAAATRLGVAKYDGNKITGPCWSATTPEKVETEEEPTKGKRSKSY